VAAGSNALRVGDDVRPGEKVRATGELGAAKASGLITPLEPGEVYEVEGVALDRADVARYIRLRLPDGKVWPSTRPFDGIGVDYFERVDQ
jgi:hypothetical protein